MLGHLADAYALSALAVHAKSDGPGPGAAAATATAWAPWASVDPLLPLYKAVAVDHALRIAISSRRHLGAPGYLGTPLVAYQNALHAYQSAGGDNTLIRYDTARAMASGSGYEPPVDEARPAPRDARALLAAARSLEHRQRALLAGGLADARASDLSEFDAWNDRLPLAEDTAAVYAERLLMERFAESVEKTEPEARALLEPLLELHAVNWAHRRAASLLRFDILAPEDLDTLDEAAAALSDRLLPLTPDLVDAFDIDEDLTGSPLASEDYLASITAAWFA